MHILYFENFLNIVLTVDVDFGGEVKNDCFDT